MSSVKELAKEVFEGRQAIAERIKENKVDEESIARYVKQLLNVFKVSNEQKETAIWIWQLRIMPVEFTEGLNIKFAIEREDDELFQSENDEQFYSTAFLKAKVWIDGIGIIKGNNDELIKAINDVKIPMNMFDAVCDYCKKNLTKYFKVDIKNDKLYLRLRETICEKEESEN